MVARHHALRQRFQRRPLQQVQQLGLADQQHLQQLAVAGDEVGQKAQLLQHLLGQGLGLVDGDQGAPPLGVRQQQVAVQGVDGVAAGAFGQ